MEQQLIENRRITQLFCQSVKSCKNIAFGHFVYCACKIITAVILLTINATNSCGWEDANTWMTIVIGESLLELVVFAIIMKLIKKTPVLLNVGEELHQVIYAENSQINSYGDISEFLANQNDDQTIQFPEREFDKKKLMLAQQILQEIIKIYSPLKYSKHLVFLINQGLLIWGFIIGFEIPWDVNDECRNRLLITIYVFLFYTICQYLDVYLLIIIILLCLPFVLIFLIYQKIQQPKGKKDTDQILEDLKKKYFVKYSPNLIEGTPECKICMQTYQLEEEVLKLPCHESHNYHFICISAWFKVNLSCPVCRKSYAEDEGNEQNLEDINQAPQ
ncbi:unnamed protein product [Paramecium pentaurelia]|uniref:RING-type domain-containing protein n=1 Tax=Paramecium pentaurelia TaxID=43138 RepID=A0A8S1V4H6_9CILI|nr:unnamed protein product [Paramecium pentaurelia]